jgi:c-di-GMP-binding flagellar brake protein YcgR
MSLKVDIYYKLISENDFAGIKTPYLKFDPEKAKEIKQEADAGLLETDKGYSKLSTTDISAGGFKCKHHIKIDVDTYLQCMLIINDEALPVIARAVGSQPDELNPQLYDLRASFDKISDTVRDRIVKYIFYQQRQLQAKFLKRRF